MKMLRITKGVTSDFFHTHSHIDFIDLFHKLQWLQLNSLKYETTTFWKFITCLSDNSYISYMGLCMCFIYFFKINFF